jgi:hypothetical protein
MTMRHSTGFCLLLFLSLLPACSRQPVRTLPEVTADLAAVPVLDLPDGGGPPWLLDAGSSLLVVEPGGAVRRYDPGMKQVDAMLETRVKLETPPLLQNGILVVGGPDGWLLVDPAALRVVKTVRDTGIVRPVAVAPGQLAGLGAGGLVLFDTVGGKILKTVAVSDFLDAQFGAGELLVLDGETLRRVSPAGRERVEKLGFHAVSPFLLDKNVLYAGSSRRELVKFSLPRNRICWRRRLGREQRQRPVKFGRLIAACPEDQNVWFFNPRGSVVWWQAQNSTRSDAAVPLNENLAVPLLDGSLLFLEPGAQKRRLLQLPEIMTGQGPMACRGAVGCRGTVYFAAAVTPGRWQLQSAVNRVDVETTLKPSGPLVVGTSLRLSFVFHNLPNPEVRIRIEEPGGVVRLDRTITSSQLPMLTWLADRPGVLTLRVSAKTPSAAVERELPLRVVDAGSLAEIPRIHL